MVDNETNFRYHGICVEIDVKEYGNLSKWFCMSCKDKQSNILLEIKLPPQNQMHEEYNTSSSPDPLTNSELNMLHEMESSPRNKMHEESNTSNSSPDPLTNSKRPLRHTQMQNIVAGISDNKTPKAPKISKRGRPSTKKKNLKETSNIEAPSTPQNVQSLFQNNKHEHSSHRKSTLERGRATVLNLEGQITPKLRSSCELNSSSSDENVEPSNIKKKSVERRASTSKLEKCSMRFKSLRRMSSNSERSALRRSAKNEEKVKFKRSTYNSSFPLMDAIVVQNNKITAPKRVKNLGSRPE